MAGKSGSHALTLSKGAAAAVLRGHPWVFREQIRATSGSPKTGDVVSILDDQGCIAHALYDETSPIAARVWTSEATIDTKLFRRRLEQALARRERLGRDGTTTAMRLVNGEGDRIPGLVIDRYANVAVLKSDSDALTRFLATPQVSSALENVLRANGLDTLIDRTGKHGSSGAPRAIFGDLPTAEVVATEHGVPFHVDVLRGQKTGAFLDQRENRQRVQRLASSSKRMLNLFSYAGGFSLRAALGGATEVTSVDIAGAAHRTAQVCFRAAGVDPKSHRFVAADAFDFLDLARKRGESFDLIVCDPPSFAPNEKSVRTALASYRRLHVACASILSSGGVFCAASCSSHVDAKTFLETIDDASLETNRFVLSEYHGLPEDHPTLPAFPEGRYLKFAVLSS
ncbi:MAG: class I SAM-dependent rRNA methyltransferase [Polyangiaceae bacterium]